MSTSGLTNEFNPQTLDGLTVIEADQIYVGGQEVNLDNLVPYTGATQTIDAGAQAIKTTYTPVVGSDVVNLTTLTDAVAFVDTSVALSYLNKITGTAQTVAGSVSYSAQLSADDLLVPATKKAVMGDVLRVDANWRRNETDASVSTVQYFGSITSSMGIYQATTTQNFAILKLADLGVSGTGKRTDISWNLNVNEALYNASIQLFASDDGTTTNQYLGPSVSFGPSETVYKVLTGTFVPLHRYICVLCLTSKPSGIQTVRWYGLELEEQGVDISRLTLSGQNASQIPIINDKKQLVGSGVSSTKVQYLDNVSSDIQTQLNGKLALAGGTMTGNILMGTNKVQSSATPSVGDDYVNKTYADGLISGLGSLYLPLSGGTITGNLGVTGSTSIGTRLLGTPDGNPGNFWLGLQGTGTETDRLAVSIQGVTGTGVASRVLIPKTLRLTQPTANRVLTVNADGDVTSSTVTPATLAFLDATSSVQTQLNSKASLAGATFTGLVNCDIANGYASRAANPLPSNFVAKSSSQRLYMGAYYTGGAGSCATIQSSDFYSSADHGADLLLNPIGGVVGIGVASPSLNWANNGIPNNKLSILGGSFGSGVNGKARISIGADTAHYSAIEAEHIGSGSTTLSFWTCESAFVNDSNPYQRMIINQAGQVGIGQFSGLGSYKLYVNGTTALAGQVDIGVSGNTTPNLKFANALSHIDNSASELYLFTAFQGHLGIQRNTTRDASSACLCLGTTSTEESQIISTKADNSGLMRLSYSGSRHTFLIGPVNVAGLNPYAIPSGLTTAAGTLVIGGNQNYTGGWNSGLLMECETTTSIGVHDYGERIASFMYFSGNTFYLGGDVGWGTTPLVTGSNLTVNGTISTPARIAITNNDPGDFISKRYSSADRYGIGQYSNGITRVFTSGAYLYSGIRFSLATDDVMTGSAGFTDLMSIDHAGNVGINTTSLAGRLTVYDGSADYTNSVVIKTPWSSVVLDNTAWGGRKYSLLAGGTGAGVGLGGFGIFDITGSAYRLGISTAGTVTLYGDTVITGNQYLNTVNQPAVSPWNDTTTRLLFRNTATGLLTTGACSMWSYFNSSVAWSYGLTVNSIFYVPNATCSILITFTGSYYYHTVTNTYVDFVIGPNLSAPPLYTTTAPFFINVTNCHVQVSHQFVIPPNFWGASTIGWKNIYFSARSPWAVTQSDTNDTLCFTATILG